MLNGRTKGQKMSCDIYLSSIGSDMKRGVAEIERKEKTEIRGILGGL